MRSAGLAAKTLALYGSRPKRSRSCEVCSSQQASSAKAEATRSTGTAKPACGSAGKAATNGETGRRTRRRRPRRAGRRRRRRPAAAARRRTARLPRRSAGWSALRRGAPGRRRVRSRLRRRARAPAAPGARAAPAACPGPRRRAARSRPGRRSRRRAPRGPSGAQISIRELGCRVTICFATRPTLRMPGTGSASDSTPSTRVPLSERAQSTGDSCAAQHLAGRQGRVLGGHDPLCAVRLSRRQEGLADGVAVGDQREVDAAGRGERVPHPVAGVDLHEAVAPVPGVALELHLAHAVVAAARPAAAGRRRPARRPTCSRPTGSCRPRPGTAGSCDR